MSQRTAVITGGGGDMGVACARLLGTDYRLLLADIDPERLERAQKTLGSEGIEAETRVLDIVDAHSVGALATEAASLGPLGTLVHTAGLSPTMAGGERIWQVNLVGSALLMNAFRPHCVAGSVAVLIASQAGHYARLGATRELEALVDDPLQDGLVEKLRVLNPGLLEPGGAYSGSKLGVIRMAQREAEPWGVAGGRVVSLSPGIIDTGMGAQEYAQQPMMAVAVEKTPLRRMGREDEIASVVEFLCSERASFVTGTDLLVDGGSTQAMAAMLSDVMSNARTDPS